MASAEKWVKGDWFLLMVDDFQGQSLPLGNAHNFVDVFVDGTPEVEQAGGELVEIKSQERFNGTQEAENRDRF
jgi:hypothetical protein